MFGKLLKKEIKELLNLGAIVSVIVIAVLYGSLGSVFESTIEKSTQKPKIAVVMEDTGAFSELIKQELGNMSDLIYVGKI
jgi:ABC-2 type transport system permease protein